jgi:hypothetical protein
MKNVMFSLAAVAFISLSSFTSKDEVVVGYHNCTYNMYNRVTGQFLGKWQTMIPDNVPCGSPKALNYAVATWNLVH